MNKFLKTVEKLSFEEALEQLEQIVAQMESGKVSFKDSVELYEKGVILKQHCTVLLDNAKLQIQEITKEAEHLFQKTTNESVLECQE